MPGLFFCKNKRKEKARSSRKEWLKAVKFLIVSISLAWSAGAIAELGEPGKDELTIGYIKLTERAPIAVAYE